MNLLERRGFVKGIEEGERKGEPIGQHNALLGLMTYTFGELSEETQSQIRKIISLEELNTLFKRVLDVNSLEEMKIEEIKIDANPEV